MMHANTFHAESIRSVLQAPLTEISALHWMLLLVTHDIAFAPDTLADAPDAGYCRALEPDQAARVVASLWADPADVRGHWGYWMRLWPYEVRIPRVRELPHAYAAHIARLRERLTTLPCIIDVRPVGQQDPLVQVCVYPTEESIPISFSFCASTFEIVHREVPLRIGLGDVDLLGESLALFLPEFAIKGLAALRIAYWSGGAGVALGEYGDGLCFVRNDTAMIVRSTRTGYEVELPYAPLLRAWIEFARRMQAYCEEAQGSATDEPGICWWSWMTEEPNEDTIQGFSDLYWLGAWERHRHRTALGIEQWQFRIPSP